MRPTRLRILCLPVLCLFLGVSAALAADSNPAQNENVESGTDNSFSTAKTIDGYLLGRDNFIDDTYDEVENWKKAHYLPTTIGAQNWFNIDRDEHVYGRGYGVPGERGTYYYFLDFDPSYTFNAGDFLHEIGAHVEGRIRDGGDKLRSFYNNVAWTYEAYLYAKTDLGEFKAGQIVQEFCIPWDNSWWEGVSYFDEYRFNPSYGFDWDNTWKPSKGFTIDTAAQYYIRSDSVSGGEPDSSAASTRGLKEVNTAMLRAAPTWSLPDDFKVALGVAGFVRGIENDTHQYKEVSDHQEAWDTDLTLSRGNLSVWAQYIDSHGVITPTRYVSGGPSDHQNSISTGVRYQFGPVVAHIDYSEEWDHHPSGHEFIFDPGLSFQLTKNLNLFAEYVKWGVTNSEGVKSIFAERFERTFSWNF